MELKALDAIKKKDYESGINYLIYSLKYTLRGASLHLHLSDIGSNRY